MHHSPAHLHTLLENMLALQTVGARIRALLSTEIQLQEQSINIERDFVENGFWIYGEDCANNVYPPLQTFAYNENLWVIRADACVHFEGPYVFRHSHDHSRPHDTIVAGCPVSFKLCRIDE